MPTSPKDNEQRMERILNAWRTLAPDETFGGMTLAQYEAIVTAARATRQRIEDLNDQLTEAIAGRDAADKAVRDRSKLVVAGVLGDPEFGPDSALYEAFGYTRESEYKSGLTRKDKQPPTK